MRIALFPGSFDPFTKGHDHIVKRSLPLFDKLIIAFGENTSKQPYQSLEERKQALKAYYAEEEKIEIVSYSTLTVDLAKELGAQYIVRGVRSSIDFEYERAIADANRHLTGIETIIFCSDPEYSIISSSLVRELAHFGHPVDEYLL